MALERWLVLDGADLDQRADSVTADLGRTVDLNHEMTALSGGQAARAGLAFLLLSRYAAWRILEMMKAAPAATRRFLPTSPFKPPPAAPPAEQFAVQDQVTHDKYGLGRVVSVEDDTALVIDFGTHRVRITTPCAKLAKL